MADLPWTSYARWLRRRHGAPVRRIAVDAGLGCPHRDGGRGPGGCTFCGGGAASGPALAAPPRRRCDAGAVARQVAAALADLPPGTVPLLFFQAYSGTDAPVDDLARLWDAALATGPFVGLDVATRPDCLDGPRAALLASYRGRGLDVWVELGLQTCRDETLRRVNRGHSAADFARAAATAKAAGLGVAAHVILGLPGEGTAAARENARFLDACGVDAVKVHSLHVVHGTALAREALAGEVAAPGTGRQLADTIAFLEGLDPRVLVMRLVTETPAALLAAPRRPAGKSAFVRLLEAEMRRRGTRQGATRAPGAGRGSARLDPSPPIA